ncbi:ArsR/SmtB family transcription factor [Aliikangiella coralliicola]|uniref:Winged helix-turn-helix transcriptional regulator n=1 Tax=Aliikangiella coralliicola TaxID=2592383 RepID=A0A545UC64_9GAMM|nr:metalloregulator ArsR/SmtB family transcription factor [Aliikangiella coralliicola]TQV87055.1 winged helix-turn-helix transcriptional regulator [Aliikangiella coralliicola]
MESKKRLDHIFFALSDSRRRDILEELSEGKKTVGQLADNFDVTLGAISKHVKLLENADLIYKSKRGRTVYCHMNFDIWKEVAMYIGMHKRFWSNRLDELENYINGDDGA